MTESELGGSAIRLGRGGVILVSTSVAFGSDASTNFFSVPISTILWLLWRSFCSYSTPALLKEGNCTGWGKTSVTWVLKCGVPCQYLASLLPNKWLNFSSIIVVVLSSLYSNWESPVCFHKCYHAFHCSSLLFSHHAVLLSFLLILMVTVSWN